MLCQQVTLLGDAEWPKVADAVIEALTVCKATTASGPSGHTLQTRLLWRVFSGALPSPLQEFVQ